MQITKKFELKKGKNTYKYEIKHKEIPIKLNEDLDEAIKYLLWYVPNISSEQASTSELLTNPEYDDYIFTEITQAMKLEDEDVLFDESIAEDIVDYFLEGININEQKLVMTLADESETKTMAVLRHIRNAIAHGNFNVVKDLVIGFDIKRYQDETEYRGIFQINPRNLLNALRNIQFQYTTEKFVANAFIKCGYKVEAYEEKYKLSHKFDLYARKKDSRYAIEIKPYPYKKEISEDYVNEMIKNTKDIKSNTKSILVVNSSYLSENSKDELIKNEIILLDIKNIKKMSKGRDMVSEIVREQRFYKKLG